MHQKTKKIIVDSGSTKATWVLIDSEEGVLESCDTMGLNPFLHTEKEINTVMEAEELLRTHATSINEIHYFGAGCSSPKRCEQMAISLRNFFTNAEIKVDHDLKAAVLATCGEEEGIVCILGTGSNACYYDGKNIQQKVPALGYILGDEGSGSFFGKKLLANFLYHQLPDDLAEALTQEYALSKEIVLTNIHNKPNPKAYLASFAKFLGKYKEHLYVQELLRKGFTEFLETHVTVYTEQRPIYVHFVGSIAHHFSHILSETVQQKGCLLGKVIKEPIHGLIQYFLDKKA